ncbi:MAG TPA: hypothetical protein VK420_22090, partial [Longimicrobium sp.]|nr:hypothetical protein [Longimicrobium sp.]
IHLSLLAAPLMLALACQPGTPEGSPDFGARSDAFRIGNGLGTQALALNALTTNRDALPTLIGGPLTALFSDAYVSRQLTDPSAREVLGYIVSCALDSTQMLKTPWGKLAGEAGLCPAWESSAPSQECLERVSACLLARNNAFGHRVPISMRGEDPARPALFALASEVPTYTLQLPTPSTHPAFGTCPTGTLGSGRDCGWQPEHTGACTPGKRIHVGAGGVAPDLCHVGQAVGAAGTVRPVLRVCEGIGGCKNSETLAQSQGSCSQLEPAVSFTCPASGLFSVLSGGYDAAHPALPSVDAKAGDPVDVTYPASEAAVFASREGAFYGNIFDADQLHPDAKVYVDRDGKVQGKEVLIRGSLYRDMWSCHAPGWSDVEAFDSSRACALPGYNCAATSLGACWVAPDQANRCATDDGAVVTRDGDFEGCEDLNGRVWQWPVTTFVAPGTSGTADEK